MKTVLARATLGVAVFGGVSMAQPVAVSAQEGRGDLADICQDPEFREIISVANFDVPITTVGECVSYIRATFEHQTNNSRLITLLCQNAGFREQLNFATQVRCTAGLNQENPPF